MDHPVTLIHVTRYRYDRPVFLGPQTVRLAPSPHARTPAEGYAMTVAPANHRLRWRRDPQGNPEAGVVFDGRVDRFEITVRMGLRFPRVNPFDFVLEGGAESWPFAYDPLLAAELAPCLGSGDEVPGLDALLPHSAPGGTETIPMLIALAQRIAGTVRYIRRDDPGTWEPAETLARGEGSCRDSGWLLVHAMRRIGLAARFCSGYLLTPDTWQAELHAWAEAFLPGAGWVGFDPTSGLLAAQYHLPLAAASDPRLASPVSGTHEACGVEFSASMRLEPWTA